MSLRKLLCFIEAWLTLAWVDFRISYTNYKSWRRYLVLGAQPAVSLPRSIEPVRCEYTRPLISISEAAVRYHWRHMNCLRRCFAQRIMLMRRNIPCELHLGVTTIGGQLKAHAWLSSQGVVINDTADVGIRYSELEAAKWDQLSEILSI